VVPLTSARISLHVSVFNELANRFDVIDNVQRGVAEESQRSAKLDGAYQEWAASEGDAAISDMAVTITSARDGTVLANYCETLQYTDIFNKY
jgi:hypothetical protein